MYTGSVCVFVGHTIECEVVEMRISTSESGTLVHNLKRVECPLRVGSEEWRSLSILVYLFMSEGRMEQEIDSCCCVNCMCL